jgi:hypothetical protein
MPDMRGLRRVVVALVLAGSATSPAAHARLEQVSPTVAWAASDGARWVVWQPDPSHVAVLDERTGGSAAYALPDGCWSADRWNRFQYGPAGITPVAIGAVVLLDCSDQYQFEVRLLHVPSGQVTTVPGRFPATSGFESFEPVAIGREWITTSTSGYHWSARSHVNWHTGASVGDDAGGVRKVPDLDRPELWRTACSALRRATDPDADDPYLNGPRFERFQVRGRSGITQVPGKGLMLKRCGRNDRSIDGYPLPYPQLGSNLVTWVSPHGTHAWDLTANRRYAWSTRSTCVDCYDVIAHTNRSVWITVSDGGDSRRLYRRVLRRG